MTIRATTLCVVGTRDSILDLFQQADQSLQITVGLPPGVFIGVYRQESRFQKKSIAIKICSGTKDYQVPGSASRLFGECYKRGNYYVKSIQGKQKVEWNWFDATEDLGVDATGVTTIHPKAFLTPLKNIFEQNKWW